MVADKANMTVAQALDIRRMAIEKGVMRAQIQKGGAIIARALDEMKQLGKQPDLVPPPGGRIHILRTKVILGRAWQEAINAAGPQTLANYDVRKVDDLYLPTGTGTVEKEFILLHNSGAGFTAALEWAKKNWLHNTAPREVFAISENNPNLHRQLDVNPMCLAATTECVFEGDRQACCVWWRDTERVASLNWVEHFDVANDWFAFSRDFVP